MVIKVTLCPNCGNQNDDTTNFCINCGTKLITDSLKCSKCGEINEFNSNFCINCGNNLKENKESTRKEFQEHVDDLKRKLEEKNLFTLSIGNNEKINNPIKTGLYQTLDDEVIKRYGSDEEKAEMQRRHEENEIKKQKSLKIYNKFNEATDYMRHLREDEAVKLFKEIIDESEEYDNHVSLSYFELRNYYESNGEYKKSLLLILEEIELRKKYGEDYRDLIKEMKKIEKRAYSHHNKVARQKATSLYYDGEYDKAIPLFEKCIEFNDNEKTTYLLLADIYHRKQDFESEIKVLKKGMENITSEYAIHNESKSGVGDKLENVTYYMENENFKWDCLPIDDNSIAPKIRQAKAVLRENEQRGIELLEDILEEGTFNNTVYYTLYKTYLKNGKYNAAISISDEAIDKLGLYSQDRLEKWIKYKDKAIAKKEKEI